VQDKRPLIIAASGAEGAAAAKAVLEWEPVQAMATEEPVLYVCLADNKQSAALLAQEDKWRAVGITVCNLFVDDVQKVDNAISKAGSVHSFESADESFSDKDWCASHLVESHHHCLGNSELRETGVRERNLLFSEPVVD
jgi:hypothetical protein